MDLGNCYWGEERNKKDKKSPAHPSFVKTTEGRQVTGLNEMERPSQESDGRDYL
jgi:hypothetical protein